MPASNAWLAPIAHLSQLPEGGQAALQHCGELHDEARPQGCAARHGIVLLLARLQRGSCQHALEDGPVQPTLHPLALM